MWLFTSVFAQACVGTIGAYDPQLPTSLVTGRALTVQGDAGTHDGSR